MGRKKRHTPEQIIGTLREAGSAVAGRCTVAEVRHGLGVGPAAQPGPAP